MSPATPVPLVSRAAPTKSPGRDRYLDLLRSAALVRVVLWHATGWAAVTFVTAMPMMFFVSGSLYPRTLDRHGAVRTTYDRMRRFLIPLWIFGAVAWAVAATTTPLADLHWSSVAWWLLPAGDPTGPADTSDWWSAPLWYLRALTWVLLLAPLLRRAIRCAPKLVVATAAIAVAGFEAIQHTSWLRPAWDARLSWHLGDLALYGGFFAVGMWHAEGGLALRTRTWARVAAVAGAVALAWWWIRPPATGVVNDVQSLHLLAGTAWLAAALAARTPLRALADRERVARAVSWLGRRSVTVYLWHSAVLAGALTLVQAVGPADVRWIGLYVATTVAAMVVVVAVAGWSEDLGARRATTWWPSSSAGARPTRHLAGTVIGASLVAALCLVPLPGAGGPRDDLTASAPTFRPRVPSQAPPLPVVDAEAAVVTGSFGDDVPLDRLVADWAAGHELAGLSVAVVRDGVAESTVTGIDDRGRTRELGDPIDVMSVTKLFTANLVYRLVDAGLISLDDPLPPIDALPGLPLTGRVTVRQLLSHRSGLVNYRDVPAYRDAPGGIVTPDDAVRASTDGDAWSGPADARYSSTNFLVLGYLLEQVTQRPYDDLLRSDILGPLGLERTTHLPSEPGEPRFSTAGIMADIDELGRAGWALLRDHVGVSDESHREMTAIDREANMGAGTMSYCPCTTSEDDTMEAFALGYTGGTTWLAYAPRTDVVIAIDVTGGVHDRNWGPVAELMQVLANRNVETHA